MKNNRRFTVVAFVAGASLLFYLFFTNGEDNKEVENPTLSEKAILADSYLKNVAYYSSTDRKEKSAQNIRKAIETIKDLEMDVDVASYDRLEVSIEELEKIEKLIWSGQVDKKEMQNAFEKALNNLARSEMEVSEMYSETNQMDIAKRTLKYAKIHIKNAMLFHENFQQNDSLQLAIESHVFDEIDSLLKNKSISPIQFSLTLDKIIDEMDQVLLY